METAERRFGIIAGDELPAFKLLLSCPAGLSHSEVSSLFDQKYDRVRHPDISLEETIAEIWERRVQQNTSLYNGLKFRYGGYTLGGGPDSSQKTDVCLHLGLTDYRTFVGTNLNPLWERFLLPSEDDWRRCQHTSNPLGNGAIVETSNKEVVVLQRSANVGEFPDHFVFPGGHPEPKEVGITRHQTDGELTQQMVDKKVSQEMFDSIIREVVEEIGVPAATLGKPVFIGISQRVLNVRPTAFFFIKCSLQSEEIQQLYSSAEDGYESTQLYTMPMSELVHVTSKMPGCHQGGFALYKLMLDAAKEN
ncbi:nudix hydrolase-like protein 9 [Perilla frutescens var. hirtella]|nr:nudix hydrolase-like protein 9 [Perilla frutescens var. hirtella]KAH6810989.1 nudix hydrolase-like protein 9 [Perilla frutescens var. frutescens]